MDAGRPGHRRRPVSVQGGVTCIAGAQRCQVSSCCMVRLHVLCGHDMGSARAPTKRSCQHQRAATLQLCHAVHDADGTAGSGLSSYLLFWAAAASHITNEGKQGDCVDLQVPADFRGQRMRAGQPAVVCRSGHPGARRRRRAGSQRIRLLCARRREAPRQQGALRDLRS